VADVVDVAHGMLKIVLQNVVIVPMLNQYGSENKSKTLQILIKKTKESYFSFNKNCREISK
jgi:hypothetical protein